MNLTRSLAAALAAAALTPASALADAPWTTPATVPGAVGYRAQLVFTKSGQATLVTDAPGSRTLLTAVGGDGRPGTPRTLSLSSALLTAYGNGATALAGTRTATTAAQPRTAPVELGTGTPSHGIATVRALPGTAGQQLFALAGNGDTVALVTGRATGDRERIVWVRHGGTLRRALTIRVGSLARGATVAVGSKGDVLVVWEENHTQYGRPWVAPADRGRSRWSWHEDERGDVTRLDRREAAVVERRDGVDVASFGERDDGSVDDAER